MSLLLAIALTAPIILNFDKELIGTDKMIFIYPPEGKIWTIIAASASTEQPHPGLTFAAWLEDSPFAPYRDPATGEMIGCAKCLTIVQLICNEEENHFPIVGGYSRGLRGQEQPLTVNWPNRLAIAFSPAHGGLPTPFKVFVRLQIVEELSQ